MASPTYKSLANPVAVEVAGFGVYGCCPAGALRLAQPLPSTGMADVSKASDFRWTCLSTWTGARLMAATPFFFVPGTDGKECGASPLTAPLKRVFGTDMPQPARSRSRLRAR